MSNEEFGLDIKYVDIDSLVIPEWKATYILRPDLLVLSTSLHQFGFIQPIHVQAGTNIIIDGSERINVAKVFPEVLDFTGGLVPVIFHDMDTPKAMLLHLRLNRGRSNLVAKQVSEIIRMLKRSGVYSVRQVGALLSMGSEELSLMLDGSLIKTRNIKEHNYAKAWVPIEAPSGKADANPIAIEKPPNSDR